MGSPKISAYRQVLFSISKELTDDEVRDLKYFCQDYLTASPSITNALAVFKILEQKRILSEDNFTFLIKVLKHLQRNDLAHMLLEIMPGITEEQKKEEAKAEMRADNYYQNCTGLQGSTNSDTIATIPAKCMRNTGRNLREQIKKMVIDKTLPKKVVQLFSSCDAYIADVVEGCVKLLLGFRSVEGLKKFWGIYSSGEFQECLGRELSTGDIEITEEDYNRALRKLEDASDKIGFKKSKSAAAASHTQGRVPKASGAGDYGQVMSQASSSAQQGDHPSPLNPATSNAPADLPPAPKMSGDVEVDRQGERGSVGNPISSGQEMKMLVTDAVPESPQSNAIQFISKMDKTPGPVSDDKHSLAKVESFSEGCSDVPVTEKVEEMSIVEQQGDQEAPPSKQTDSDAKGMEGQQSSLEYRMDRNPRGLCMIINNVEFEGPLEDCPGNDKDADKLAGLFQKLHFEVEVERNLTASTMYHWFKRVSRLDHTDYDCFACCILTRGALGQLCGADSTILEIQHILGLFTGVSCPSLNTKPKMFFIQACRGDAEREGVEIVDLQETDDEPRGIGAGILKTVPDEADFLLSYATVPGYVSYRSRYDGSLYVNALVDQITKHHETTDMLNILTAVNTILYNKDVPRKEGIGKQVGASSYTLVKSLYLRSLE